MSLFKIHCKPPLRGLSAILMECLPLAESDVANDVPTVPELRAENWTDEPAREYEDVVSVN